MRVRTKLIAMTLFVSVIPLAMSASQIIPLHERALNESLLELHSAAARWGAQALDQHLEHIQTSLKATVQETIDWKTLSDPEQQAALGLLYGQFPASAIATLTRRGTTSHRVFSTRTNPAAPEHPAFSERDAGAFDLVAPPAQGEVTAGATMRTEAGDLILPLSLTDPGTDSLPSTQVSLGLSLAPLCSIVARARPKVGSVLVLDAWDHLVCENERVASLASIDDTLRDVVSSQRALYSRKTADGEVKGALATGLHGFRVVVEQPLSLLSAPAHSLRHRVLLWLAVGVVAAIASGWVLGRGLLVPLDALARAARGIARGEFEQHVTIPDSSDELAELAESFETMTVAIAQRDAEITEWNNQLQARVDERSRQLEETRDALLSAQKMAGLAVTTAGVAHEMSNPLTGVLGLAQVLAGRMRKNPEREAELGMLNSIIYESKRMQAVLRRMESLGSDSTEMNLRQVPLATVLDGVLLAYRDRSDQSGVHIARSYLADARVLGDPYKLHAIFAELLDNALKAVSYCQPGVPRKIDVSVSTPERNWVDATLSDNGCGIQDEHLERVFEPFFTTKLCDRGEGLGLTQVYRLVQAMGGTISVRQIQGGGTQMAIRLPAAREGALLA